MGRISKEEKIYRDGMERALSIAKKEGVDGLEEFMKRRGRVPVSFKLTDDTLNDFTIKVKTNVVHSLLLFGCMVLRDEFDFGKTRLQRFANRLNSLAESIEKEYLVSDDIADVLLEECGIDLHEFVPLIDCTTTQKGA